VHADAPLGAALREPAAGGQRLDQRHAPLQPHRARALHLAVDVHHRLAFDPDDVAVQDQDVAAAALRRKQRRHVHFHAERLAFAGADDHGQVCAQGRHATSDGQQLGQPNLGAFQRVAAGPVDLPQHAGLVAAHLQQRDRHLRLLDEVAAAQAIGDELLGLGDAMPAQAHRAQQRVRNEARLGDPCLERQIGVLVHGHTHHVASAEPVLRRRLRGRGADGRVGGRHWLRERVPAGNDHAQRGQGRAREGVDSEGQVHRVGAWWPWRRGAGRGPRAGGGVETDAGVSPR
jgi:hypothetical protein